MADETGRPPVLGAEIEHYWLVQRMAKATGVDLVQAMASGAMTQNQWAGIISRCRGCQWSAGCDRWLSKPTEDLRALPEPCLNRKRLTEIKEKLAKVSAASES